MSTKRGNGESKSTFIASTVKIGAAIVGIIYTLGFLVVSLHLSQFNIVPFTLFRIQYLVSGLWLLFPLAAIAVPFFWIAAAFEHRFSLTALSARSIWKVILRILVRFAMSLFVAAGWLGILVAVFNISNPKLVERWFSGVDVEFLLGYIGVVFLFSLGIFVLTLFAWLLLHKIKLSTITENLSDLVWGGAVTSFTIVIFFSYVGHFANEFYPRIPASIGGGAPVTVQFVLKNSEGAIDATILAAQEGRFISNSYDLILQTNEVYVVLMPGASNNTVLVLNKDEVRGVIFPLTVDARR